MLKKTLFVTLIASLFFVACKKGDTTPASQFVINGISDVDLTTGNNSLYLTIKQSSGAQERVTLTVTGLPSGVTAIVDPIGGTPDFDARIRFNLSGNAAGGSYAVRIVGTSASYTKTYEFKVTVPEFNGFIVDGVSRITQYMSHDGVTNATARIESSSGAYLFCNIADAFPTADGTYTYPLDVSGGAANSMQVMFFPEFSSDFYSLRNATGKFATVRISGGKMSLSFPAITLYTDSGSHAEVSASAREL